MGRRRRARTVTERGRFAVVRLFAAIGITLSLAGCAARGGDAAPTEPGLGPAERVAGLLVGNYAGAARDEDGAQAVLLDAEIVRVAASGIFVRMDQRAADETARSFQLVFEPTRIATRLSGRFSPLDADDAAIGSCPLTVSLRRNGFVATTDGASCRFGQGDRGRALIKEIAHDGQRLVIADRVVRSDSGEPVGSDRVLEFERVRSFTGWSGVREVEAGPWRVSRPLRVRSDGVVHRPVDAAGVGLGFSFELAPHRVRADESPVLRLRVFDDETGALLSQAWADPQTGRLGVALPDLQLGLRALER